MNVLGKRLHGTPRDACPPNVAGWLVSEIIRSRATAADLSCAQKLQLSSCDPCGSHHSPMAWKTGSSILHHSVAEFKRLGNSEAAEADDP